MKRPFPYLLVALAAAVPAIGVPINSHSPGSAWAAPGSGSEGTPDDDIEDKIEDDVEDAIEDALENDVEDDIEDDIEDDVESDIEDNIENDVEDDIEDSVESDVEDDIEDDVESDVEDSVEDDVEDGVEARIEDSVTDKIDSKIEDKSGSGKDVERNIEQDVEDAIESKIEDKSGSGDGEGEDFDDEVEDQIASRIDDRSGSSRDSDDQFDDAKMLAKIEHDAARAAADAEQEAARSAAKIERDQALALPDADEDAVQAEYELAKEAADDEYEAAREEAEGNYAAAVSAIEAEEEDQEENSSGSSNSAGDDDDGEEESEEEDENSGSGSPNSGSSKDDDDDNDDDNEDNDDDDDNSGKGSSNSASNAGINDASTANEGRVFTVAFDDDGNEISRGEWLMLASPDAIGALTDKGFVVKEIEALDGLDLVLARVEASGRFSSIKETEAAIRDAAPDAEIDYNHVYHKHGYRPATKRARKERHGTAPTELFDIPALGDGAGRSVGIIDTNVDVTHSSLRNAHLQVEDFVPYEHQQPETHGTSVASILAGESEDYHGLLPKAKVFAASVFFNSPAGSESATTTSLVRALDWMTENNVAVVNMSLTGPANTILKSAIDRAYEQGTIVVAAVGNDGPAAPPLYPAAYDNVVAVTAVSKKKKIYRLANRGDHVDFAAPGVNVLHAADHGEFAASSGTSMAAPFVTAILAASSGPDGRVTAHRLNEFANEAEDLGKKGFDPVYGNGLIRPLRD